MARFALFLLAVLAFPAVFAQEKARLPVTGLDEPALASFDELMTSFVEEHKVPGATLAIAKDGRLIYARGFGFADLLKKIAADPLALFRIASVSKPITAVAILKLVEEGKLKLDDRAFEILKLQAHLEDKKKPDPRLKKVTIRHLLQHTGGWDRTQSFDPMFRSVVIAKALAVPPPAGPGDIIRYMLGQPLDFDPGTRYAYSNFGYCVLGRIIEKVTGQTYESYVKQHVLGPLGIRDMRIGKTLPPGRAPKEVHYYDEKERFGPAVFADILGKKVPLPYGAWHLEAMDSHGGWIASAVDLVRFATALDRPEQCKILKAESIRTMFARPAGRAGSRRQAHDDAGMPLPAYYACGWQVRPVGKRGANTWHMGALSGTATLLVRRFDGLDWAVLFNTRNDQKERHLGALIDPLLHQAAAKVKSWPAKDLFGKL